MNKLIFVIGIMLMSLSGMAQYPIKTIFKGDSVIILTIQQSEKINEMLDKSSKSIKETSKKNKEYETEIEKLNEEKSKNDFSLAKAGKDVDESKEKIAKIDNKSKC